jgi:hypothetical protein
MPVPSDTQVHRIAQLKRAYQRQLKRKLTVFEQRAVDRALLLTALAENAACNPHVHPDTVVRLDGAASRARAALAKLVAAKPTPTRQQYLETGQHGTAG